MEQSSGRGFTPQNFREITPLRRPRGGKYQILDKTKFNFYKFTN